MTRREGLACIDVGMRTRMISDPQTATFGHADYCYRTLIDNAASPTQRPSMWLFEAGLRPGSINGLEMNRRMGVGNRGGRYTALVDNCGLALR